MMAAYQYARTFMAEHGNPNQWGPTNWPPEELIRADIAAGDRCYARRFGNISTARATMVGRRML